jgi:hypothetical protein
VEERLQMTAASVVRRGPATWAAITVTAALTAVVGASAVASVLRATGVLSVDRAAALQSRVGDVGFSYDEAGLRTAEGFAALVSVPVFVVCVVLLVGLLRWRDWAREGVYGVFGLAGFLLVALSLVGLRQDPPGRNAGTGLLVGLVVLGVVGMLLTPSSREDFDRKALQRALRERERARTARS